VILVLDVGTSSVRAAAIRPDGSFAAVHQQANLPETPFPGLVEFDATVLLGVARGLAQAVLDDVGAIDAIGVTNQRASTIVWDRATGEPVAPALGWQDLRTVGTILELQAEGFRFAPNASATKLAAILDQSGRDRDLCFGTVDSWLVWHLTDRSAHVIDRSNAGVTGMLTLDGAGWDRTILQRLEIAESMLPTIVPSTGIVGEWRGVPVGGIAGDQQASLVGQSCVRPGMGKITFGTGGMLDVCLDGRPEFATKGEHGCFPIVAWEDADGITWGAEAVMLAAGSNVEWLVEDLGLLPDAAASAEVAAADCGGVMYVPALLGLGAPTWDVGARGTLLGLTRGSGRGEIVRAVLEGVAQRGADLVEAAEADAGPIESLRVDGGMSRNPVFVQALADATQRPVEVAPVADCTTVGAAYLAGLAVGTWSSWDDIADLWSPAAVIEPGAPLDREKWRDAVSRASGWIPELSAIQF
jgi:glycerol kinase